ncbi:membrane lipoprotein lipid attachment site-containing protein [Facklamia sp. P13069]|uniref:membrane lipoprotein lipid attachment site-containing protein n=1 Tax=Facklamia sp. P13069 TaxID=3421954 RepID=UPI003D17448B
MKKVLFMIGMILFLAGCSNNSATFDKNSFKNSSEYFLTLPGNEDLKVTTKTDLNSNVVGVVRGKENSCGQLSCQLLGNKEDKVSVMFIKADDYSQAKEILKDVNYPITEEFEYMGTHSEPKNYDNTHLFSKKNDSCLRSQRLADDSFILYFGFDEDSIKFLSDYKY